MFLELQEIKLDEGTNKGRIQVLKEGKFDHPYYGTMVFDDDIFDKMIANFNDRVRGIDIQVNYSHADYAEAAGWMDALELKDGKLYADVEWTDDAAEKIRAKKFKYISAEFNLDYKDNETAKRYGPTIVGAALTNIPFVKGMDAVLSEIKNATEEEIARFNEFIERENEKDKTMNLDDIKKGVTDLSEADKAALLSELGGVPKSDKGDDNSAGDKALSEKAEKLAEENEKLKSEIKFNELLNAKKAVPAQKDAFLAGDMAKFAELAVKVNFDEDGTESDGGEGDDVTDNKKGEDEEVEAKDADEAQDKIAELAEKAVKEAKKEGETLSYSDAVSQALNDNPKLAEKYEAA